MRGKKWSVEEEDYLVENYSIVPLCKIAYILSRPLASVSSRVSSLRLKNRKIANSRKTYSHPSGVRVELDFVDKVARIYFNGEEKTLTLYDHNYSKTLMCILESAGFEEV